MSLGVMFLASCKTSQLSSYDDDVYANPTEEKQRAVASAQQKAKEDAEARAQREKEALARKEKEDNNPYYKDPAEGQDDYYDYKYASRINRFDNPISGAGYYDTRYTNYYTYNQNPAYYGSSIYNSYNWMPSNQFNGYSSGLSIGFASGYGYNNYGYGSFGYGGGYYGGYNNPGCFNAYPNYGYYGYNGFGYGNPYNAGYYNGYNTGLNNGWGYFNSLDANSDYQLYNGPRGSNGGGNSERRSSAGLPEDNSRTGFLKSMAQQQEERPRFSEAPRSGRRPNPNSGAAVENNVSTNIPNNTSNNTPRSANNQSGINQGNNNNPRNGRSTEVRENSHMNAPTNSGRSSGQGQESGGTIKSGNSSNSEGGSRSSGSGGSSPRSSGSGGGGRR